MEYPMRLYGHNVLEVFLAGFLVVAGWLLILFAIVSAVFFMAVFYPAGFVGGLLAAGTAFVGVLLLFGSAGVRQNRAALDVGYGLFAVTSVGWILDGLIEVRLAPLVVGVVMVVVLVLLLINHHEADVARFRPRFLSLRQFETMIAVAETIIDSDGQEAISPFDVAIRLDRLLSEIDSPVTGDLKLALTVTEWALPLLIFRPFPFSDLGSRARRQAVEAVIEGGGLLGRGVFRTLARTLKVAACVGYYSSPEAMASVGFVPFEDRPRSHGVDQSPRHYPDPLLRVVPK
jgi:hypothetical protein